MMRSVKIHVACSIHVIINIRTVAAEVDAVYYSNQQVPLATTNAIGRVSQSLKLPVPLLLWKEKA